MITKFVAKNYGCLKDVSVALTPLHAFIGPNDSGKSTLLRGLLDVAERAAGRTDRGYVPRRYSREQQLGVEFAIPDSAQALSFRVFANAVELGLRPSGWGSGSIEGPTRTGLGDVVRYTPDFVRPQLETLSATFKGGALVRFDADQLKQSSSLVPDDRAHLYFANRGAGLPGVLDEINGRGDDSFRELVADVRKLFPSVKTLRLNAVTEATKEVRVELHDGTIVPAMHLSEGLLYYIAYRAAAFIHSVSLLLVEEPETGLHPSRIGEVIRVLRNIVEGGTQVILSTHSPLVINELRAEEVSVVTRTPSEGTRVTPIAATPNFASRAKVYALGELWLSYADADTNEGPLLNGGPSAGVVLP